MKKLTKKEVAGGAIIALASVAVLSATSGGKTVIQGAGGGGGFDTGGGSGAGFDFGADMAGLNSMYETWLSGLQQPTPQEPSLLDTPPIFPMPTLTPLVSTPEPTTSGGGFWDSLLGNINPPSKETMTAAAISAPITMMNPFAGLGAFLGISTGQKVAGDLVDRIRADNAKQANTNTPAANPAPAGYINVGGNGGGGSSGGGGTGSARIVDTRTSEGQNAMAGASYIKIHKNQHGSTNGKVTVY